MAECRQIRDQQRDLLIRLALGPAAEKDHGRRTLGAQREERGEIGVGRNQHALFRLSTLEHIAIAGRLHPIVADVDRIMTGGSESGGDERRKRVIDEELQPVEASGSSRSRTASAA